MRILYWTELFWPYIGGVEVLATQFIPEMTRRGFQFEVITSHGSHELPDEESWQGVRVNRLPFHTALKDRDIESITTCLARTADIKRRVNPSIVHINLTDASIFFHLQTRNASTGATIVSTRLSVGTDAAKIDSLLLAALSEADRVTTVSHAMLREVLLVAPEIADRASVIYNGLKVPDFKPRDPPSDDAVILLVGRLVAEKGFDLAIHSMPRILASCPDARLWIGGDGPERPNLERLALELDVENVVAFLGWITPKKIHETISRSTCVVVPSRWQEAFGQVALQAAQMKRPVVATRVGGLPEVVGDGGIIVDPESPGLLAEAVLQVLLDPEGAARMGELGHGRAAALFSWQRYIDEYERLYRSLS